MWKKLEAAYLKTCYWIAFSPPFRPALYTRAIAARWPFQQSLAQMNTLSSLLLSVKAEGCYLEIGCAEGWTTIWQNKAMSEAGVSRAMNVVDTFAGFTPDDIEAEYQRGKAEGTYDSLFAINSKKWFDESMRRAGVKVTSYEADAAKFDYSLFKPIAFCFLDVDLYHPIKTALPAIRANMAPGGMIVVDDCDASHDKWDGAFYAYREYCEANGIQPEIVAEKLGIIRT